MRIYLSVVTLVAVICLQFPTSAQNPANKGKRVSLRRSPKIRAMAAAFKNGKLPEPLRLPQGNVDQQAAVLAKAVAAGDDSSTAALYAAVLASGYGVRDADGSVMQTTENGQGLIFESHEIAATAKLYGEDYGVMLSHLSESFTRSVPELKDVPLATALLDGIRNGAKSNHPAVRFWARFIVELGKKSAVPYDLLKQVDPTTTRLDAVQVALILRRLSGDMAVVSKRTAGRVNQPVDDSHSHHARPQSPCGATDMEDLVNDFSALSKTTLFGIIMERLGGAAANYAKAAGIANAVLTVFKFLVSYASVEVEITMDGDELVRTKTTQHGEKRTLKATLRMDTGKWQMINCLRPELNKVGLDVDIPQEGPLAGVKVDWVLVLGGDTRGGMAALEDFWDIITLQDPTGDGIVFLDAAGTSSPGKQYTNSEGVSEIDVVGMKQKTDLSKRKLFEKYKAAGVRVDIQLKTMKITDQTGALSNITDIAGNALSFLTKDVVGGVVGTTTETLYRSNWYGAKSFYFPVKDWEPCTGQWQGTITYRVTSKREGTAENLANKSSWNDGYYYEAKAQIDGTRDSNGNALARVQAHASQSTLMVSTGKSRPCFRVGTQTRDVSGSGSETTTAFSVTVNPRTREYSVSAPTMLVPATGADTVTSEVKGTCNNPFNKDVNYSTPVTRLMLDADGPIVTGKGVIDPANPDEISGTNSETIHLAGGVEKTVTIIWNLKRCRDL
jgi:hypothetical protein